MCGIFALFGNYPPCLKKLIKQIINDTLKHRGPMKLMLYLAIIMLLVILD